MGNTHLGCRHYATCVLQHQVHCENMVAYSNVPPVGGKDAWLCVSG